MKTSFWKVTYNHGLANSIVVQANSEQEAKFQGLAEYRKNYGCDGVLDSFSLDFVVASAKQI